MHLNVVADAEGLELFLNGDNDPLLLFEYLRKNDTAIVNGQPLRTHDKITVRLTEEWTEKDPQVVAMYHVEQNGHLNRVHFDTIWGVSTANNPEQAHLMYDLRHPDILIVTVDGKAGTGKDYITILTLLKMAMDNNKSLLYMRENQPVGKDPGAMPGDRNEKNSGTLHPLFDTIKKFPKSPFRNESFKHIVDEDEEEKSGVVSVMDYILTEPVWELRGRTFDDTYMVFDESQNSVVEVLKTFGTRGGKGSKVVLLGSHRQRDNARAKDSFCKVIEAFETFAPAVGHYAHNELIKRERGLLAMLFEDALENVH